MTFSGRFLYTMIQFAQMQGASIKTLLDVSGYVLEELVREDLYVNSLCYNRVISRAIELTGDTHFGLHAGEHMSLSSAGLVGQITQSAATIREAMQYACDFINLGCRAIPKTLVDEGEEVRLTFSPLPLWLTQSPEVVKQTALGLIAFTLREFNTLSLQKSQPLRIEFSWGKPKDIAEYERVFQCELRFSRPHIAVVFSSAQVESPVISSDYRLLRVLVEHANQKLKEFHHGEIFFEHVKTSIINMVKPNFPTIEEVAATLNLGVRTMQRRLSAEGHTFKELLEMLRKEFAMSYLTRNDLTINEIAYLLNYADASSFIRSFKRWTGQTPQQFRETAG